MWNFAVQPPAGCSELQNQSTEHSWPLGHAAGWRKTEIKDGALGSSSLVVGLALSAIAKSFYLRIVWNFEGCSSSSSDPGAVESIEVRLINPGLRRVFTAENSTKCLLMTQVGIVWK